MPAARAPIFLARCYDDPALVERLVHRHAPYLPVQRYFANDAELQAISGRDRLSMQVIAPNFRGDWAFGEPLVDGAEAILHHPPFVEAAARLFDAEVVRPQQVYANLTWQLPFHQGGGHTDVPAFLGIDRTRYPITFLTIMGHSGLFEAERVKIATAVSWSYRGHDGGFEYWPNGPHAAPAVHEGDIHNTAIMGDNDVMWHRVRPVGRIDDGMVAGMTLESRLVHRGGDQWAIEEGGETLATFPFEQLRISVSWKALVFADQAEADRYDSHAGDLTLDEVVTRLADDLRRRGVDVTVPDHDPVRDPAFIEALQAVYIHEPTTAAA